jgi:hypothetical protein
VLWSGHLHVNPHRNAHVTLLQTSAFLALLGAMVVNWLLLARFLKKLNGISGVSEKLLEDISQLLVSGSDGVRAELRAMAYILQEIRRHPGRGTRQSGRSSPCSMVRRACFASCERPCDGYGQVRVNRSFDTDAQKCLCALRTPVCAGQVQR